MSGVSGDLALLPFASLDIPFNPSCCFLLYYLLSKHGNTFLWQTETVMSFSKPNMLAFSNHFFFVVVKGTKINPESLGYLQKRNLFKW